MGIDLKQLASMSKNLKILYIEDDDTTRSTTLKLLNNFFTDITIAVDGLDGFDKFLLNKFDLILSDINMPKLNGIEMLKLIREKDSTIPVLLLSAYNDTQYFMQAIELNIDGYIIKPISQEQFTNVIFKIVQKIIIFANDRDYRIQLERDVRMSNQELMHKLNFDSLTNLYSRYSFFADIKKLHAPSVLLVDINKFRTINEVYSSGVGTDLLKEFAIRLKNTVKDKSYKIYRLSADEFGIVDTQNYENLQKYEILIDELFSNLNNIKIDIDANIISVDITIGFSTVEENAYESAKIALEYAKKYNKAFMRYSNNIDYRKESSLALKCKDDIILAIKDKRVIPVYQGIVDKDEKLVKYETLMRLQEKDTYKLISPFHFLDVAIKTRLYDKLSSIIVMNALSKISNTKQTISINLTYGDIKNISFAQDIEDFILSNEGLGNRLVFEITESESIESYDDVKEFIKRFREFGVKFAIDDFGTGFSNFEYILEIEPDYLKIDGSLIKDIDKDLRAHTLVEAIVQFSHKLGIKVIAEYVHSKIIFDMLKELDVDEYQGFYFHEPLEGSIDANI